MTVRAQRLEEDDGLVIRAIGHGNGGLHKHLERMEASMPIGIAAYGDWFARCTQLVEQERPAYALALRQARNLSRDYPPQLVKSETMEHWVDMAQSQMYRDAVTNAMGVLALVIREGQQTQRQM